MAQAAIPARSPTGPQQQQAFEAARCPFSRRPPSSRDGGADFPGSRCANARAGPIPGARDPPVRLRRPPELSGWMLPVTAGTAFVLVAASALARRAVVHEPIHHS